MRGESGAEAKARKHKARLVACYICQQAGGTLDKDGSWYSHRGCREEAKMVADRRASKA